MKGLDLSKFKKASSGESHTVFQHPDGHKIFISHKALKPGQRADLGKLATKDEAPEPEQPQKLANGGPVVPDALNPQAAPPAALDPQAQFAIPMSAPQGPMAGPVPSDTLTNYMSNPYAGGFDSKGFQDIQHRPFASQDKIGQEAQQDAARAPATPAEQFSNVSLAPQGSSGAGFQMPQPGMAGLGQMKQGIRDEANATGAMGTEQARAGHDYQMAADEHMNAFAQTMSHLENERQLMKEDLNASHIDPNHYIGSMGTGGKIATAIGLILGGMGAGLTGKENPAQKFLEQQIDRDMQAQKANLSKKEGLLHANMQEGMDARSAENMARVQLNDMYAHQVASIASKYQDPMAQARAKQMIGQLDMQSQQLMGQAAQTAAIKQGVANGSVPPEQAVQYLVPKEMQKDVLHEIGKAQKVQASRADILAAFDEAAKDNTLVGTVGRMGRQSAGSTNFQNLMMPILKDKEGRINETEIHMMSNFEKKAGEGEDKVAAKRAGLVKFLNEAGSAPISKGHGIDLERMYGPKDTGFTKR